MHANVAAVSPSRVVREFGRDDAGLLFQQPRPRRAGGCRQAVSGPGPADTAPESGTPVRRRRLRRRPACRTDRGSRAASESGGSDPGGLRVQQKNRLQVFPLREPAAGWQKPLGSDPHGCRRCRFSDSTSGISSRCRPRAGLDDRPAHGGTGEGHRGDLVLVEPVEPHPPFARARYAPAAAGGGGGGRSGERRLRTRKPERVQGGLWDSADHPALESSLKSI